MSLVIHKRLRLPFMAIVAFVLSVSGIVLVATPAQAAQVTADVVVQCNPAQDGSATVYVENVSPQQPYRVHMAYDTGYTRFSAWIVDYATPADVPVFGPYGEPVAGEGDSAESVTVTITTNGADPSTSVMFDRTPQCGARPNRDPVVQSLSASGTRYDETIVVPITGASDPDGDTLTFRITGAPNFGTAQVQPPTADYPGAQALIVYHPDTTFVGDEFMTYQASDGRGGVASATASVRVRDSIPVTASSPTFIEPTRSHMTGQVVVPSQSGVRYQVESTGLFEHDATGMTIDLPQGETVTVKAFTTQSGTTLVGTKSWQHAFTYLLKVDNKDGSLAYINKVRVTNPNDFGVWYSYGTFTTTSSFKQDGRVWLEPSSSKFVGTARKVLDWKGSGENWSDEGSTKTTQVRPRGRITFNCSGRRNYTYFHMDNRASTMKLWFMGHIGFGVVRDERVAGGRKIVQLEKYSARPGKRVKLVVELPSGHRKVLARAVAPRGCRN